MKRIAYFLIAFAIAASSCRKNWQCTCNQGASSITISKAYKAEAASECAAWQVQVQDTIQDAACSI